MNPIIASQGVPGLAPSASAQPQQTSSGAFGQVLESVNASLEQAERLAAAYAQGKVPLIDAVLAAEHADSTFGLVVAVRNRALAAYREIINMAV